MATFGVAIILFFSLSCSQDNNYDIDFSQVPRQTVRSMSVVQTKNGNPEMRMRAPLMQTFDYEKDSVQYKYDFYPDGFYVDAYTEEGELETTIVADQAKHVTLKKNESWSAFGNVVVTNHLKGEKLYTDTIYWNRMEQQIYTDCYVKMESPSGFMQGYGMTSDERANNATILRPFDNYYIMRDSSEVYVDSLNLLGPLPRK